VILDNVGNQPLRRLRRALTPTGTLISNAGGVPGRHLIGPIGAILRVVVVNGVVRQRLLPLADRWEREHLLAVTDLIEAGQVTPVLDRTYPLLDTAAGLRYLESGHARGKIVVTVA
jgi:NADPH:quinone reductase-like Zn-dependent oxidoreductase